MDVIVGFQSGLDVDGRVLGCEQGETIGRALRAEEDDRTRTGAIRMSSKSEKKE